MRKFILPIVAVALICFSLVGATYALLALRADPLQNTFVAGNITVSLVEPGSKNPIMLPGATLTENPRAIVRANSEDCWLFIKVQKAHDFDDFLSYSVREGWTRLQGVADEIYYRRVSLSDEDQTFEILEGNQILVKEDVTKAQYDAIDINEYPTLIFTAYAVQTQEFETADAAWVEAAKLG